MEIKNRIIYCVFAAFLCAGSSVVFGKDLGKLTQELDRLLLRYTENHPDVIYLRAQIEYLRQGQPQDTGVAQKSGVAEISRGSEIRREPTNPEPKALFSFKKTGKLIDTPEGMPAPGPYWPVLVNMREVESFPFDYALYFSTDHHRGKGGIWLYVCSGIPSDPGCWRSYDDAVAAGAFDHIDPKPSKNPIYVDAVQGRQTETPHANVIDKTVYMTYHNYGAGYKQSTLLATSRDGVNFTRINGDADSVILDYDPKTAPGNGHTGYFRWGPNPFSGVHYRYVGYSLHGGGPQPHFAMWGSDDAVRWQKLRVLPSSRSAVSERDRSISWVVDVRSIQKLSNNEYLAISTGGVQTHGRNKNFAEIYEVQQSHKGDRFTSLARKLLTTGPPGSGDDLMASQPTALFDGSQWHLIYVGYSTKLQESAIFGAVGELAIADDRQTNR